MGLGASILPLVSQSALVAVWSCPSIPIPTITIEQRWGACRLSNLPSPYLTLVTHAILVTSFHKCRPITRVDLKTYFFFFLQTLRLDQSRLLLPKIRTLHWLARTCSVRPTGSRVSSACPTVFALLYDQSIALTCWRLSRSGKNPMAAQPRSNWHSAKNGSRAL